MLVLIWQSLHSCHPAGIMSHTTLVIPDCISLEAASLLREVMMIIFKPLNAMF